MIFFKFQLPILKTSQMDNRINYSRTILPLPRIACLLFVLGVAKVPSGIPELMLNIC
jgi:hypothetical protein